MIQIPYLKFMSLRKGGKNPSKTWQDLIDASRALNDHSTVYYTGMPNYTKTGLARGLMK